jgi:hypothetical protein
LKISDRLSISVFKNATRSPHAKHIPSQDNPAHNEQVLRSPPKLNNLQRFASLEMIIACLQKPLISGDRLVEVSNMAARDDRSVIPERERLTHLSLHDEQKFKVQNILMRF